MSYSKDMVIFYLVSDRLSAVGNSQMNKEIGYSVKHVLPVIAISIFGLWAFVGNGYVEAFATPGSS